MKIGDILRLPGGSVVDKVEGYCTKLDSKNGISDGTGKPWSFTRITLEDEGQKIRVTCWNKTLDRGFLNQRVGLLNSAKGDDLILELESYNDKRTGQPKQSREIKANTEPFIIRGAGAPAATSTYPQPQQPPPAIQYPPYVPPQAASAPAHDINKAKKELARAANLYILCISAVKNMVEHTLTLQGVEMPPELFQAAVSTMFIRGDRAGLVNDMPVSLINLNSAPALPPAPPPAPTPPPQPVAPPLAAEDPEEDNIPF